MLWDVLVFLGFIFLSLWLFNLIFWSVCVSVVDKPFKSKDDVKTFLLVAFCFPYVLGILGKDLLEKYKNLPDKRE